MEEMANQGLETQVETQAPETQSSESTTTQQVEQTLPQSIRVKYNHQEMELPYDEAVTHIQKGMNYEKAVERAKQEARDATYAEMGYEWRGKPITTEAEYKQAVRESELAETIKSQYSNVPEELVGEILEGRRFREQYQSEQQTAQRKQATEKMYQEFLDAYPDTKPSEIPADVWKQVKQGKNLLDAYVRHERDQLKKQLDGVQAKEQAAQANQANALTSTGSAKGQGAPDGGFIPKDVFEANKADQNWMSKNYDLLKKSMGKWGK